jgi:hypothetical protein
MSDLPRTPTAAFLLRARVTNDPEGDLIADMRDDLRRHGAMPRLFPNIEALRAYLYSRNACPGALDAAPGVWRRYRQWLDRHGGDWSSFLDRGCS